MNISVVIPSYNRAPLIGRALDSVINQHHAADEIIVVDDGSDDGTATLLKNRYPFVRVIPQAHAGVSAARNRGIDAASSEWIALLDSDDAWQPNKLAAQAALASARPELRLIHCNESWIRNGKPLAQRAWHNKRGGELFFDCLPRCVISPSAVMLKRDLLLSCGGFDETLPACEDYDLWLRLCQHETVGFVDQPLVIKYGGHADQLSRTTPALDRWRIRALVKLLEQGTLTPTHYTAVRDMLAEKLAIYINGAKRRGHHDEVNQHEALSCRLNLA